MPQHSKRQQLFVQIHCFYICRSISSNLKQIEANVIIGKMFRPSILVITLIHVISSWNSSEIRSANPSCGIISYVNIGKYHIQYPYMCFQGRIKVPGIQKSYLIMLLL